MGHDSEVLPDAKKELLVPCTKIMEPGLIVIFLCEPMFRTRTPAGRENFALPAPPRHLVHPPAGVMVSISTAAPAPVLTAFVQAPLKSERRFGTTIRRPPDETKMIYFRVKLISGLPRYRSAERRIGR